MEKQKIMVLQKKWISFPFIDQGEVLVKPYLSLEDKIKLTETYLNAILEEGENKYSYAIKEIEAEYAIIVGIIDLCTNLSIDFEDNANGIDNLIGSGLWDKIKAEIINYNDFRKELSVTIAHVRENVALEKSVGMNIDRITNAIVNLAEKVSSWDVSTESVQKLMDKFKVDAEAMIEEAQETPFKKVRKKRTPKKESSS